MSKASADIARNELLLVLAKIEQARPNLAPDMGQVRGKVLSFPDNAAAIYRAIEDIKNSPRFSEIFANG